MGSAYRNRMIEFANMRTLDVWYAHLNVEQVLADFRTQLSKVTRKRSAEATEKARSRDSMNAFSKLTTIVDGQRRIVSDPPLIVPIDELLTPDESRTFQDGMHQILTTYRRSLQSDRRHLLEQFRIVEVARKVVGVGSVGTRAWIVLLLGRDDSDPLFLQAKEAQPSVLERFVRKSEHKNCGQRVVTGQHLMQALSDIFLGWVRTEGIDGVSRDFYFRQLRDWKSSIDPDQMIPSGMLAWGQLCGWTLARAHARSGDRVAIASYLGKNAEFERAIAAFAESYAEQNQRDYEALQKAASAGRVKVITGM